jgi:predicted 3-demethylubiquinone-9 3-methyltransferase (glyoxalase superfamily)
LSRIAPCLWFNGAAEEAAEFYVPVFPGARITSISRYGADQPFPAGAALMLEFELAGQRFQALNGGANYTHSPAMSLSISASDAAEVDRYWSGLLANGGNEGRCGWLTDRFGVSWQVVPEGLGKLKADPDPARARRALQAMMQMKKLDIAAIRSAADQIR